MIFMFFVIVASVPLLGGHFSLLAQIRVRYTWLLLTALLAQILITEVLEGASRPLLTTLHLVSYAEIACVIWVNRRIPGIVLIGAGALSNGITIALNGGTLPASRRALEAAGFSVDPSNFANSGIVAHPILSQLGDVVATPYWLPFRNVISIGDVLILIGAFVLVHCVSRSQVWLRVTHIPLPARRTVPSPVASQTF